MKQTLFPIGFFLLVLSCKQGPKTSEVGKTEEMNYREIGMEYAQGTQKVLGKTLMTTIQEKGVVEAVKFCNERAYPLTDSMSTKYNANIRRVSDRPRNPKNKADAYELAHIETFKKALASGDTLLPILSEGNGKVKFYYPIVTQALCLNCHGTPGKTMAPDVIEHLSQLYPDDQATGYGPDEVRGIWSIVFDVSEQKRP